MEEKKLKVEPASKKEQRLTYEQLNEACANLSQQNQYLTQQLQLLSKQLNQVNNAFKRLDCLFAVLRYESVIKDPEFISACVEEIKGLLTIPEAKSEEPDKS